MIEIGHRRSPTTSPRGIVRVPYRPVGERAIGVEIIPLSALRDRAAPAHFARPQRLEFLLLLLFTDGAGTHEVDFVAHAVAPGTVLTVLPGQVQRFHLSDTLDGLLVAIEPAFLARPGAPDLPARCDPPPVPWQELVAISGQIRDDSARFGSHPLGVALVRHRLATLLHLLALHGPDAAGTMRPTRQAALVRAFQDLVERHHRTCRSTGPYARRLGAAERTLTRACLATTGLSAKRLIDRRLTLEAKRLLAHTDSGVAAIGETLGFSETTNFIRFFRQQEGRTPTAFRLALVRQGSVRGGADR